MAFKEDFNPFFEDFGVNAYIEGRQIKGIFENRYIDDLNIAGVAPVMDCESKHVETVKTRDVAVIDGTTYRVVGIQPDGTGITTLILEKQ